MGSRCSPPAAVAFTVPSRSHAVWVLLLAGAVQGVFGKGARRPSPFRTAFSSGLAVELWQRAPSGQLGVFLDEQLRKGWPPHFTRI